MSEEDKGKIVEEEPEGQETFDLPPQPGEESPPEFAQGVEEELARASGEEVVEPEPSGKEEKPQEDAPTEEKPEEKPQEPDKPVDWESRYKELQVHSDRRASALETKLEELERRISEPPKKEEKPHSFDLTDLDDEEREFLEDHPVVAKLLKKQAEVVAKAHGKAIESPEVKQILRDNDFLRFQIAMSSAGFKDWQTETKTPEWEEFHKGLSYDEQRELLYANGQKPDAAISAMKKFGEWKTARKVEADKAKKKEEHEKQKRAFGGGLEDGSRGRPKTKEDEFETGVQEELERQEKEAKQRRSAYG